jgi:hypothetical protein
MPYRKQKLKPRGGRRREGKINMKATQQEGYVMD